MGERIQPKQVPNNMLIACCCTSTSECTSTGLICENMNACLGHKPIDWPDVWLTITWSSPALHANMVHLRMDCKLQRQRCNFGGCPRTYTSLKLLYDPLPATASHEGRIQHNSH